MIEKSLGIGLFFLTLIGMWEVRNASASGFLLPKPSTDGKVSLEKTIRDRRTTRDFREKALSVNHLSQLLWAAQGITDPSTGKRAAPSGGALYPLDIYMLVGENSVESLEPGVYHYSNKEHSVSMTLKGDRRRQISSASLSQMWMAKAPVLFVITAEYKRITGKYGERGIRYALIEVGHASQNLFLEAEALGLGAGIVGAFNDTDISKVAGLPSTHEPLLIVPVGYKK